MDLIVKKIASDNFVANVPIINDQQLRVKYAIGTVTIKGITELIILGINKYLKLKFLLYIDCCILENDKGDKLYMMCILSQ